MTSSLRTSYQILRLWFSALQDIVALRCTFPSMRALQAAWCTLPCLCCSCRFPAMIYCVRWVPEYGMLAFRLKINDIYGLDSNNDIQTLLRPIRQNHAVSYSLPCKQIFSNPRITVKFYTADIYWTQFRTFQKNIKFCTILQNFQTHNFSKKKSKIL